MPLIIADRGASAEAPEHTIAALELALSQGADALALDVQLTRDGQPIVFHDFTLERTTDGAGAVAARTVRELKRLDAGLWRGRRFHGQRVQTLQEVLERFRDRTRFWIELRGGSDVYPGIEERVVSTIEIYEVADRVLVQSRDLGALTRVHDLNPDISLGAVMSGSAPASLLGPNSPVGALCVRLEDLAEEERSRRLVKGLACYVRTGGSRPDLTREVAWDVDGIITSRPGLGRTRPGRNAA